MAANPVGAALGNALIVTPEPLDVSALLARLTDASLGASAVFVGSVRSPNRGREVARLEYEAYEEMALAEMGRIVAELCAGRSQPDAGTLAQTAEAGPKVVLAHRLGRVLPGEASLVVAVATPHRAQALALCAELVEACKARLPIWKLEVLSDGSQDYVPGLGGAAPTL